MRFRHLSINDLAYGYELKEVIELLEKGIDYNAFDLKGLINMIKAHKFLCDYELMNEKGKELLFPYLGEKKKIESAVGRYFNTSAAERIIHDLEIIKCNSDLDFFEYFGAFIKFGTYKRLTGKQLLYCVNNHYIPFHMVLRDEGMVCFFPNEIRELLVSIPDALEFLIESFDLADSENRASATYYFPCLDGVFEIILDNYLNYQYKNLTFLEALDLHKDNDQTYRLSRKQRTRIKKTIEEEKDKLFSSGRTFGLGFGVAIDPKQKEPLKISVTPENEINVSFSYEFLKSDLSYEAVIKRFFWFIGLVDKQSRINGAYKRSDESTFSEILHTRKRNEYGSPSFQHHQGVIYTLFGAYYAFLLKQGIDFADVLNWFINDFLSSKLNNFQLKSEVIHDKDDLSNCERLFNVIPDLLKQYKIFVEEGELTNELIDVSTDAIRVDNVPSLVKDKYYEVIKESDITTIFNILFNDQCTLNYIDEARNAATFFDLLNKMPIKKGDYKYEHDLRYIDFLIDKEILKEDANGELSFVDGLRIAVLKDLHKNEFMVYRRLAPEAKAILDEYKALGWLKTTNGLFSSLEADYICFHLDNTKFSNSLALRNKYEHGKGMHLSKEVNKVNYLTGLRLLTEIVAKIEEDIAEYKNEVVNEKNRV